MKVKYKVFTAKNLLRLGASNRETVFRDAAKFAEAIGKEKLITITTIQEGIVAVTTVWFWE